MQYYVYPKRLTPGAYGVFMSSGGETIAEVGNTRGAPAFTANAQSETVTVMNWMDLAKPSFTVRVLGLDK